MSSSPNRQDEELKAAQEDLRLARQAVLSLLDKDLSDVARDMFRITSEDELDDCEKRLIGAAMRKAEVLPPDAYASASSPDRAYCPLCREGSLAPYQSGFALPSGLRQHLMGEGNARRCAVTEFLW